jgi:hypothetical protein
LSLPSVPVLGVVFAISCWLAMVCSGGASARGPAPAPPTVGGATGVATLHLRRRRVLVSGGGAAELAVRHHDTLVSCGGGRAGRWCRRTACNRMIQPAGRHGDARTM